MSPARLAVCIVTHDDADDLPACLEAVAHLTRSGFARPIEVAVVDCASADDSVARARAFARRPATGRQASGGLRIRSFPWARTGASPAA